MEHRGDSAAVKSTNAAKKSHDFCGAEFPLNIT
jgi:hypothetical protein